MRGEHAHYDVFQELQSRILFGVVEQILDFFRIVLEEIGVLQILLDLQKDTAELDSLLADHHCKWILLLVLLPAKFL